jgi:hypothetical protein
VRLYNLWRVYPTRYRKRPDLWRGRGDIISWNRFLTVVNEKLPDYYVVEDTLRKATEMAIDWAAPAAGVPDDPAAFVGSNPGPDPGT